ncbi:MAG: acyl carrier protein [Nitrospirota bacterium]
MVENVEQEIISIISDVSGTDTEDITADMNLANDLEIDSIKAIEIVVAIEKKYKISVRDEDIPSITTPRQVIDLTIMLLKQKTDGS